MKIKVRGKQVTIFVDKLYRIYDINCKNRSAVLNVFRGRQANSVDTLRSLQKMLYLGND